jgi:hypothetical protein
MVKGKPAVKGVLGTGFPSPLIIDLLISAKYLSRILMASGSLETD